MKEAPGALLKWRKLGAMGVFVAAATLLVACAGGIDITESEQEVVHVEAPLSQSRAIDPPLPSDYEQVTNNRLTPEEASLNQLWALANSEIGDDADGSLVGAGVGITHFSAAITSRCYSLLTESETADLDRLKDDYESLTGAESVKPAEAYVSRAKELCM